MINFTNLQDLYEFSAKIREDIGPNDVTIEIDLHNRALLNKLNEDFLCRFSQGEEVVKPEPLEHPDDKIELQFNNIKYRFKSTENWKNEE